MPVRGTGALGLFESNSFCASEGAFQKRIGPHFDPSHDVVIRGAAVGRIILEGAVVRWIVRKLEDNAVRQPCIAAAIVSENCPRTQRSWRVFGVIREHDFHTVGRQHFGRAGTGRHRQRMRSNAEKRQAAYALSLAVIINSLTYAQNMPFVENAFKAEPRCPEAPNAIRGSCTEESGAPV